MNYTPEEINLIILSSFEELTYSQKRILLSDFNSATPDFVKYEKSLIKSLPRGVYNKVKERFKDEDYRVKILAQLEKSDIKCITYFSENYPERLKQIPIPPVTLYCKGNLKLLDTDCFAVVGSRRTLPQSIKECKKVTKDLTRHFTIVSGIADGADTAAVEAALDRGKIISVLANGFNHFYPAINRQLIGKVAERGLLLSEYPPDVAPQRHHFPIRNRIIAGLAKGTLIVSAGAKSGALYTAEYAELYGREVFAFPYNIGVASGEGCNFLIKNGAKITVNALDIFGFFGLDFKPQAGEKLSKEEETVLSVIREEGEAFIADVAETLGIPPYKIIPVISKLEIKGLIVRIGGNKFSAV